MTSDSVSLPPTPEGLPVPEGMKRAAAQAEGGEGAALFAALLAGMAAEGDVAKEAAVGEEAQPEAEADMAGFLAMLAQAGLVRARPLEVGGEGVGGQGAGQGVGQGVGGEGVGGKDVGAAQGGGEPVKAGPIPRPVLTADVAPSAIAQTGLAQAGLAQAAGDKQGGAAAAAADALPSAQAQPAGSGRHADPAAILPSGPASRAAAEAATRPGLPEQVLPFLGASVGKTARSDAPSALPRPESGAMRGLLAGTMPGSGGPAATIAGAWHDLSGEAAALDAAPRAAMTQTPAAATTAASTPPSPAGLPVDHQVALHVQKGVASGLSRVSAQLHPDTLGSVDIALDFGPDRELRVMIVAERPETLELLQREARQIEKLLQGQGFSLDSGGLDLGLKRERDPDQSQGGAGRQQPDGGPRRETQADPGDAAPAPPGRSVTSLYDLTV